MGTGKYNAVGIPAMGYHSIQGERKYPTAVGMFYCLIASFIA